MSMYRIEPKPDYELGDCVKWKGRDNNFYIHVITLVSWNSTNGLTYVIDGTHRHPDVIVCKMIEAPKFTEKDYDDV